MIIPYLCVVLFTIFGTWVMIDPVPGHILLNFPEFLGRILTIIWFTIVRSGPVVQFHMRLMPITSILYYADLIEEMLIMAETPLGGPIKGVDE